MCCPFSVASRAEALRFDSVSFRARLLELADEYEHLLADHLTATGLPVPTKIINRQ